MISKNICLEVLLFETENSEGRNFKNNPTWRLQDWEKHRNALKKYIMRLMLTIMNSTKSISLYTGKIDGYSIHNSLSIKNKIELIINSV